MADTPEIPEAKDPFEKRVAISIAIMAVLLSYISMRGDNAKTDAVIETSKEANTWAQYQSKSLKQNLRQFEVNMIALTAANAPDATKKTEALKADVARYESEMKELTAVAKVHREDAEKGSAMNYLCDFAGLFLLIAIVIDSVAILSRQHLFWFISLGLAVFGAVKFFF
ncbi:MAG: DUF4337 domain-containing protein [Verrucomicrobia bacterium]|nr:DUF4337 domain-containing protein [Verrucomicrobiota bacterium]